MSGFINRARQKLKRWQNRTPAQQEANKAAQKRYRERKKGQVAQLQTQADALAAQARCPTCSLAFIPDAAIPHTPMGIKQISLVKRKI